MARINLSTMEGQTEAWEDTYAKIAAGELDIQQATTRIRALRGVYILRVEGVARILGLLARFGKDNEQMRKYAEQLTKKIMGTMAPVPEVEMKNE